MKKCIILILFIFFTSCIKDFIDYRYKYTGKYTGVYKHQELCPMDSSFNSTPKYFMFILNVEISGKKSLVFKTETNETFRIVNINSSGEFTDNGMNMHNFINGYFNKDSIFLYKHDGGLGCWFDDNYRGIKIYK
jgi:hypothetical protein